MVSVILLVLHSYTHWHDDNYAAYCLENDRTEWCVIFSAQFIEILGERNTTITRHRPISKRRVIGNFLLYSLECKDSYHIKCPLASIELQREPICITKRMIIRNVAIPWLVVLLNSSAMGTWAAINSSTSCTEKRIATISTVP